MGAVQHRLGWFLVTIRGPVVLPADVVLVPVAELPEDTRAQIEHAPGDYALTRPRTRTTSSIVDARTAGLLQTFRDPKTIVEAIIEFSEVEHLDPRETLESSFSVLAGFLNTGLLVAADSDLAGPIDTTLAPGDVIGGLTVVEPVHVIDDTEVHLARTADGALVALKIARGPNAGFLRRGFEREATMLARLDGTVTPRLVGAGEDDGRPFLAVSWCPGVDVVEAAGDLRERGDVRGLYELADQVLAAYSYLHAQGVLHGDVHPRNAFVDGNGIVRLIDFGLAVPVDGGASVFRGGIDLFLEPELARARRADRPPPPASPAGEQYSVAALLYLLLTGAHTHAFSLEEPEMFRQLAEDPPLPFSAHAVRGLDAIESTVVRALAKDPAARYESMEAFRRALRHAASDLPTQPAASRNGEGEAQRLLASVVDRLSGQLLDAELEAPTATVNLGAAGLAYAALRIAAARDDPALLALADRWSGRALQASATDEGFENAELEITADAFGRASLFHSRVGVHCVEALVAHARGDELARSVAIQLFAEAARTPSDLLDITFGVAGTLLGCVLLLEAVPASDKVRMLGDELAAGFWARLEAEPPIPESVELPIIGAAHGWAGYLYALLRWAEARGGAPADGLEGRLDELASMGAPVGRGLRWPSENARPAAENSLAATWCNGSAGFVHLWLAAERVVARGDLVPLAEAAAWTAYETVESGGDLCCGTAGRAYALLALHQRTGEPEWVDRARILADRGARLVREHALRPDSLYKGQMGVAVLAAELAEPEWAAMPLFAREGWPAAS